MWTFSGRKGSIKHAFVSTDEDQRQKAARTEVMLNARRLNDIPVSSRQGNKSEETVMDDTVCARKGNVNVALPRVWDNCDLMAYVQVGSKYIHGRRFGSLRSRRQAP